MTVEEELAGFEVMEARLRVLMPEMYRGREEEVLPVSMGSAGLEYGADGRVAWDEIWGSFCDLAMAGGPPHRGTLLEPGSAEEMVAAPAKYDAVVAEMCRGLEMVTGLCAEASEDAGWVKMYCTSAAMAGWLARAIVMENVSARCKALALYLPAGAGYRVEKEIKNVVTATAKTTHFWMEHISVEQQQEVADVLRAMEKEAVLLQAAGGNEKLAGRVAERLGGRVSGRWVGVECGSVKAAIWMMRWLVAGQVMSHREETRVFVPVDGVRDPEGEVVVRRFARVWGWAGGCGVLECKGRG